MIRNDAPCAPKTKLDVPYFSHSVKTFVVDFQVIYVIRNPRDVCQSLLNHYKTYFNFKGNLQTVVDMMTNDNGINFGPFHKSVLSYWQHRDDENLLIVFYEDMQKDLAGVIRKVAKFLDLTIQEDQIGPLVEHLSFNNMKKNAHIMASRKMVQTFSFLKYGKSFHII